MKNIKKLFLVLLCVCLASQAFAGGGIEPSETEKAQGWRFFKPIGFKLLRPAFFDEYEDYIWSDNYGLSTEDEVVLNCYFYAYADSYGMKVYNDFHVLDSQGSLSDEEYYYMLYNEVLPSFKPLYGLFVLRTPLIGDAKIDEITGYDNNIVIRKTKKYTQVFAYNDFNFDGMLEDEAEIYREMANQVLAMRPNIKCVDPLPPEFVMLGLKNLKFDTTDLEGNRVKSDILKNYDVTMINIWATWCPPCKAELPEIAKLYEVYKEKGCNILGVTGDVEVDNDEALEDAIYLKNQAGCNYTMLKRNSSFDALFDGLVAWPMTIFVDRNGNIIADGIDDLIVGSRSYEDFAEAFDKALEAVGK